MLIVNTNDVSVSQNTEYGSPSEERKGPAHSDSFFWSTLLVAASLCAVNCSAAVFAPVQDCDEVFNYWEPTHYLNHGYGLQTWEYSPEYAIRSWLYISVHALVGKLSWVFTNQKFNEFIYIRSVLGILCAFSELRLFKAVSSSVGSRIAFIMLFALVSSTGMFYASVAFLPSSFSMYTTMLGTAAFMDVQQGLKTKQGIMCFGIGTIVGWPFSAALILPLFADELAFLKLTGRFQETINRVVGGTAGLLPVISLDIAVNAVFFHRIAFSSWRIVSYNVFSGSSKGPDIFGTEPWHFYIRNLLLNFNAWFPLALCAGPIIALQMLFRRPSATKLSLIRSLVFATPFYLWLAIFSVQPHKEERFMYPAYPFLCLNAALTLHNILHYIGRLKSTSIVGRTPGTAKAIAAAGGISLVVALGILRTLGTVTAYRAPLQIYAPLWTAEYEHAEGIVCLGKEWYRFPSSFFLPDKVRARFVKSDFDGLLPGQFSEERGHLGLPSAWITPSGMNDQNIGDPGKHVDIGTCTFLVDSYFPGANESTMEPSYVLDTETWELLSCSDFLGASSTHPLARISWIPDWKLIPTKFRRRWGRYCLLKRKKHSS